MVVISQCDIGEKFVIGLVFVGEEVVQRHTAAVINAIDAKVQEEGIFPCHRGHRGHRVYSTVLVVLVRDIASYGVVR